LSTAEAVLPQDNPAANHLSAAIIAVDEGVEQVRALAYQLRPPALDKLGLVDALADHATQWSHRYGLDVNLSLSPLNTTSERAEALFRTAQEALTNVARHADATRVEITLHEDKNTFALVIEDNGCGRPADSSPGLGLIGIRERLRNCGGSLELESEGESGLTLTARVPKNDGASHGE
jgi:signal transduction histidine kinase